MKFFMGLVVGIALMPMPLFAMENGRAIAGIAIAAKQQNMLPTAPWISTMRIINDSGTIALADGRELMRRPQETLSYTTQDDTNRLFDPDVSRFYKPKMPRFNAVWNYAGRTVGEVISVGIDSGYQAEKITVKPALFLGYARSMQVGRGKYFAFATGGWLSGRVTHRPCREVDGGRRYYYCANLSSWDHFRPPKHQLQHYYQFLYKHEF